MCCCNLIGAVFQFSQEAQRAAKAQKQTETGIKHKTSTDGTVGVMDHFFTCSFFASSSFPSVPLSFWFFLFGWYFLLSWFYFTHKRNKMKSLVRAVLLKSWVQVPQMIRFLSSLHRGDLYNFAFKQKHGLKIIYPLTSKMTKTEFLLMLSI